METSTFYDFSQKFKIRWYLQSLKGKEVNFYYDRKQKAYCRKISNVLGVIKEDKFIPKHPLVKYSQIKY